jgi:plasmid stabilization system protein ParE
VGRVRWTDEANNWLISIYEHIVARNPSAAQRTIDGIAKKAEILELFPEAGQRLEHSSGRNLRKLLYGHYRIAYLIEPNGEIFIIGVYHGAMDLERHLPEL